MMSLAVIDLMAARLSGSALQAWADTWGQPLPVVSLMSQRPEYADQWPYVALAAQSERRDLIQGTIESLAVVLACGLRCDEEINGVRAISAMADACITALCAGGIYTSGRSDLILDYADLDDTTITPPTHEVQIALSLRLLSDAQDPEHEL